MLDKKEDRRVRYTKRKIKEAMLDSLTEVSLDKVTVTLICEKADINRSTFYVYYADPLALYDAIEKETIEGLTANLGDIESNGLEYMDFLKKMTACVGQNDRAILALIRTNSTSFKRTNMKYLEQYSFLGSAGSRREYAKEYFLSGVMSVIDKWLIEGKRETSEQIAEILFDLTNNRGAAKNDI